MAILLNRKIVALIGAILLIISVNACRWVKLSIVQEPTLAVAPLEQNNGPWKIAASDTIKFTVTAPAAEQVKILYRPVVAMGRHIQLTALTAPTDRENGTFSTEIKAGKDFAGDVWAEAFYPGGAKKATPPMALTTKSAIANESARSDKFTGGQIQQAPLQEGQPDVKITVDVPAFKLTFWQNGKEVKTYQIGVGRKEFPIVIGGRQATAVIWNPDWVPPNSDWVEDAENVEPGERIEADDPRNPLGKIKIPLGQGYLIHEAAKPSDIGHLVSHGCIRMLTDDLFDLTNKIVAARSLPISQEDIERAKTSTERMAVKIDPPLPVDINYGTLVVEGGVLHIYPDVYHHGTNTVQNLRAELQTSGLDASKLDDQTLQQMLDRVSLTHEYAVRIADIQAGQALIAGQTLPLTDYSVGKKPAQGKSASGTRRRQRDVKTTGPQKSANQNRKT